MIFDQNKMKTSIIYCLFALIIASQNLYAQCNFKTPSKITKITYATREFTFSDVTINGQKTTYLAVEKGEKVKITTKVQSKKKGDYCPSCIVQVYWGIRGHASECAKSFYGYQFNEKKSKLKFDAPMEDGIYYITMGSTLDYSCKNNVFRPQCSADAAFAVLKVGNPDPQQKIEFETVERGNSKYLKASLLKAGCFTGLDKIEWFLDGEKLGFDDKEEIPLNREGNYKVVWSNCLNNASDTFKYSEEEEEEKKVTMLIVNKKNTTGSTDFETLVQNSKQFVLENLIFDLGKSAIKPEAKPDLNKLAKIMKDNSSMRILLEGHTDKRGSSRKNLILSEQRVESVKEYLVNQGVNDDNIEIKGWGDQKPLIITNDIEKGKVNRRVEVKILSR